jgi:hypothetical protein
MSPKISAKIKTIFYFSKFFLIKKFGEGERMNGRMEERSERAKAKSD